MNQASYRLIVLYFALFSLFMLISGAILFTSNIGFTSQAIIHYYRGNEATFSNPKSYFGELEHIYPHLAGFGLFIMSLAHFLIFTQDKKKVIKISITLFILALLNLISGLLIISGLDLFIYIKAITSILFTLLSLYMILLVIINTQSNKT